jgi:hypothetical protein
LHSDRRMGIATVTLSLDGVITHGSVRIVASGQEVPRGGVQFSVANAKAQLSRGLIQRTASAKETVSSGASGAAPTRPDWREAYYALVRERRRPRHRRIGGVGCCAGSRPLPLTIYPPTTLARHGGQGLGEVAGVADGQHLENTSIVTQLAASRALARSAPHEHPALGNEKMGFVGRYLRLPGRPMASTRVASADHLPAVVASPRGSNMSGGEVAVTSVSAIPGGSSAGDEVSLRGHASNVRRRINRKSRPISAHVSGYALGAAGAESELAVVSPCAPGASIPWTRRFCLGPSTALVYPSPCNVCRRPCRTSCRGCSRRICADCALARRPCAAVPSLSSRVAEGRQFAE